MPNGRRVWIRGDAFSLSAGGYTGPALRVIGAYDRVTRTVFLDERNRPPIQGDAFLLSLAFIARATAADVADVRRMLTDNGFQGTGPLIPMSVARLRDWFPAGDGPPPA